MEQLQHSSRRGQLGLCVGGFGLFPQPTWFAHPFRYIFQIRDTRDSFHGVGVLKTVVANVSKPSILKMVIILHYVHIGVGTG